MWDLILSVPDHCLSFYFASPITSISINLNRMAGLANSVLSWCQGLAAAFDCGTPWTFPIMF